MSPSALRLREKSDALKKGHESRGRTTVLKKPGEAARARAYEGCWKFLKAHDKLSDREHSVRRLRQAEAGLQKDQEKTNTGTLGSAICEEVGNDLESVGKLLEPLLNIPAVREKWAAAETDNKDLVDLLVQAVQRKGKV